MESKNIRKRIFVEEHEYVFYINSEKRVVHGITEDKFFRRRDATVRCSPQDIFDPIVGVYVCLENSLLKGMEEVGRKSKHIF